MKCIENNRDLYFDFHVVPLSLEGRRKELTVPYRQCKDAGAVSGASGQTRPKRKRPRYNKCAGVQANFA